MNSDTGCLRLYCTGANLTLPRIKNMLLSFWGAGGGGGERRTGGVLKYLKESISTYVPSFPASGGDRRGLLSRRIILVLVSQIGYSIRPRSMLYTVRADLATPACGSYNHSVAGSESLGSRTMCGLA